ncbi:hypothetical protein ACFYWX_31655 [Streptomyces sp. NPDC002888]|uniref:hypothetical protein n=1 Tax=Streptomyces sp. NPDC002888 TaxID=3364668 RepID=UPI0036823919
MAKHHHRTAAVTLALGGVLTLTALGTGTAQARADGVVATLQTHSNVRDLASSRGDLLVNTGSAPGRFSQDILCWYPGERVTAGGYTTNVWYWGDVTDSATGRLYEGAWVWGGNVNVGADPSPLVKEC